MGKPAPLDRKITCFCDTLAKQHFTTFSLRAQLRTLGSRKTLTLTQREYKDGHEDTKKIK